MSNKPEQQKRTQKWLSLVYFSNNYDNLPDTSVRLLSYYLYESLMLDWRGMGVGGGLNTLRHIR